MIEGFLFEFRYSQKLSPLFHTLNSAPPQSYKMAEEWRLLGCYDVWLEDDVMGLFRHVLTTSYFTITDISTGKQMAWPWDHRFPRS
jgi:hypothetical protein